jgi:uncharacterized protein YndB with AHSA1/START domain
MATNTDRIEKKVLLRAPQARVWRAISDSSQFGSWFGVKFDAPFAPGKVMIGSMMGTTVDAEIAKRQEQYKGHRFEFVIDRIEPMRLFSFRWHPFAMDAGVDYSKEPSTLVAFVLEEVAGGTMLTVTESGFDQIPLERRAKAFEANDAGWTAQMTLIEKYLAQHAQA